MSFDQRTYEEQKPAQLDDELRLCPDLNGLAIMEFADQVEACPFRLDMLDQVPHPECGSAGCVVGHARLFWGGNIDNAVKKMRRLWRVDYNTISSLCYSQAHGGPDYKDITKPILLATLRHLARTGEVRFEV